MNITDKIKQFINNLNERGVVLPFVRDPKTSQPSVTLTLMLISFAIAAGGLITKFTKVFGEVDVSGATYLFLTTAGLYLGRRMGTDANKKTVEMEKE